MIKKYRAQLMTYGPLAIALIVISIIGFSVWKIQYATNLRPDLLQCRTDLKSCTDHTSSVAKQLYDQNLPVATTTKIDTGRQDMLSAALYALINLPGAALVSPQTPGEGQPFSLKVGETATIKFGCGGGEEVHYWDDSVTVKSIERIPGSDVHYKATIKIGNDDNEAFPADEYVVSNIRGDELDGYRFFHQSSMQIFVLTIESGRVVMIAGRAGC